MKDVLLLETIYPCWAYALARVGRRDLLTLEWLHERVPTLRKPYSIDHVYELGDIMIWKCKAPVTVYEPVSLYNNEVIWETLEYKGHAGVYEDGGFVSDMVTPEPPTQLPLIVRKRRLNQLTNPNWFIPVKSLQE